MDPGCLRMAQSGARRALLDRRSARLALPRERTGPAVSINESRWYFLLNGRSRPPTIKSMCHRRFVNHVGALLKRRRGFSKFSLRACCGKPLQALVLPPAIPARRSCAVCGPADGPLSSAPIGLIGRASDGGRSRAARKDRSAQTMKSLCTTAVRMSV